MEAPSRFAVYAPLDYSRNNEQTSYPSVVFAEGYIRNVMFFDGVYHYLFDYISSPPPGGWYIWEGVIKVGRDIIEKYGPCPGYCQFEGEYKPATESQIKFMVNGISPFPVIL